MSPAEGLDAILDLPHPSEDLPVIYDRALHRVFQL